MPDQLDGLAFRYRAGDPLNTVTSGAVQQAFDLSGNGRHATAAASGNRPLAATDSDDRAIMRFGGSNDALLFGNPPSLAAGVAVFMVYRIRQHVDGGGIMAAGKAGTGSGNSQFFEFNSQLTANRTALVAKTAQGAQPARITTTEGIDPTDTNYAVFRIDDASAELRDLQGVVTDASNPVALGTPDVIAIGAGVLNQSPTFNHAEVDVMATVGVSNALAAVDQLKLIDCATARWGV